MGSRQQGDAHNPGMDLTLPNLIRNDQQSIPIIETNEQDSIMGYHQPGFQHQAPRQTRLSFIGR